MCSFQPLSTRTRATNTNTPSEAGTSTLALQETPTTTTQSLATSHQKPSAEVVPDDDGCDPPEQRRVRCIRQVRQASFPPPGATTVDMGQHAHTCARTVGQNSKAKNKQKNNPKQRAPMRHYGTTDTRQTTRTYCVVPDRRVVVCTVGPGDPPWSTDAQSAAATQQSPVLRTVRQAQQGPTVPTVAAQHKQAWPKRTDRRRRYAGQGMHRGGKSNILAPATPKHLCFVHSDRTADGVLHVNGEAGRSGIVKPKLRWL